MSISMVIPTYTITPALAEMAIRCAKSYRSMVDELIIVEDGGEFNAVLMSLADTYIYNWKNKGFTANVNRGWRYATKEYVMITSSDTYLISGNLADLCLKGRVTSPLIENQGIEGLAGSFFVVHNDCPQYLLESMKTYYSDEEYKERTSGMFTKIDTVVIHHDQAQTVKEAGIEGQVAEDREAYDRLS